MSHARRKTGRSAAMPVDAQALALQLETGTRELALAGAMLAQAMGDLRAGFVQVAGAQDSAAPAAQAALRQVMVALQAEDTLGQLLQAAQRRQSLLARALRQLAAGGDARDIRASHAAWPSSAAWGDAHGSPCPPPAARGAGTHEFF